MTSIQEFNCILCKETFDNKEDLKIHFRKHGDPNFNQSVKKNRPQNEGLASAAEKNETEMVSCDVCSEMFPTISKAITHKHKMHPDHDTKYFCPWCGKLFTMKHLYNKHLESNHVDSEQRDDSNFHCDACDVDFFVPTAMQYHNKFFHRQDTDLPSIGQSKKLKMCSQNTVLQIYYCSFCGDEYNNKVNLHKHVGDDHSDENQSPEDVLRCPLCDAIFYHLDAYELHLTFHTTEDLYSEKNEMFDEVTEFSLETVAPVMEKVENVEPQDLETEMNAVGLDKFLELAMNNSLDEKHKKSKKHKKHKKSKKAAITLDEFLNMNKDVFGEGLDFQGVEEVPTQVVKKRLKQKKPTKSSIQALESSNLEKLKKQGIVVKMKPSKVATMQNTNLGTKMLKQIPSSAVKPSSKIQTSSEDVLSRLISQSNNQIKIVKKTSQETVNEQNEPNKSITDKINFDKRGQTPENIEVECDVNMPSEYTSSENETKEVSEKKITVTNEHSQLSNLNSENHHDGIRNDNNSEKEETDAVNKEKTDTVNHEKTDAVNQEKKDAVNQENNDAVEKENSDADDQSHDSDEDELDNLNEVKNKIKAQKLISEKPLMVTIPNNDHHDAFSLMDKSKNSIEDKTENHSKPKSINPPDQKTTTSLNALKHLSHLITIKSVSTKTSSAPASPVQKCIDQKESKTVEAEDFLDEEKVQTPLHAKEVSENNEKTFNNFEHLKKLSSSISIKSLTQSPKNVSNNFNEDGEERTHENLTPITNKVTPQIKNPESKPPVSPKLTNNLKPVVETVSEKETKPSNIDLLKHLTNITAKPVSTMSKHPQISKKTISNMPSPVKKNIVQNTLKKEESTEEIEIFNIDDSDDEPDKVQQRLVKTSAPSPKANVAQNASAQPVDKLKLSKQVTVKSMNQQASPQSKSNVQKAKPQDILSRVQRSMAEFSDDDDDGDQKILVPKTDSNFKQKQGMHNDNIKNTLKNLGKHITVKSGMPSPNLPVQMGKDQEPHGFFEEAGDSDSDSEKTGVKITEITEDNGVREDDMAQEETNLNENVSVKSPEHEFSDNDDQNFDDVNDDDFEHQIKATTVKRHTPNVTAQMLHLQNMNKNITVKSLSEKKQTATIDNETVSKTKPIFNSEVSIKPFKQCKTESRDGTETENVIIKNNKNSGQVVQNRSINQSIASCSQQNTVNKEVTVKTIQTKTVIQEITTTVTKTIKTVNQTVKQELQSVQSSSQNNQMKFQKVQGMKPSNNQVKNFPGVTVRHPTGVRGKAPATTRPSMGAVRSSNQVVRPSNQVVPVRPSNQIVPVRPSNQIVPVRPCNQIVPVRPANQLVPMRPVANTARMSRPRMSAPRSAGPGNQQKQMKAPPQAMNKAKRPIEEPAGHFSCFKKPKESLIPVSDIPSFSGDQGGEALVQYSSSHMSKSNFTSATKTVAGGKVVTSTQMKSEMSASSQHLERLNSMSGLKVVKTSQTKQATKVEEKCESSELSASKRNTLEAIEKLQKQGLLVKKPRLESSNDSDHSDEDNSYITEEPDDD